MKIRLIALTAALALTSLVATEVAHSQQPAAGRANLFDASGKPAPALGTRGSGSSAVGGKMTTAELRQARALYRAQQRVARLEYNLWMGYEPLRPNWNSVPMMSSRYGSRRVYVPVYLHTR